MYTPVSICSNALIRLGTNPIQSFTDGSDVATTCDVIYHQKKLSVLNSYPWRFTMGFAPLSRMSEAPVAQWQYQFTLPSDRIQDGPAAVYTSNSVDAYPISSYDIVGNRLLSNNPEIWIKYQRDIDESLFPPYFSELLINIMMYELSYAVADSSTLRQELRLEVYGMPSNDGVGGLMGITRQIDSRDNPSIFINSDFLCTTRY